MGVGQVANNYIHNMQKLAGKHDERIVRAQGLLVPFPCGFTIPICCPLALIAPSARRSSWACPRSFAASFKRVRCNLVEDASCFSILEALDLSGEDLAASGEDD